VTRHLALTALLLGVSLSVAAQSPLQLTPAEQGLLEASYAGNLGEVRKLVSAGASIDAADAEGRTPLMYAAFNGHTSVTEYLLDQGAAIDARESAGRTALMYASSGPYVETVELLLERGADVNARGTREGFTALMTASAEGLENVVQLLLDRGADRTIEDQDGDTALSFARQNGHDAVVALLEKE
jgi:ankyrin repeat protein